MFDSGDKLHGIGGPRVPSRGDTSSLIVVDLLKEALGGEEDDEEISRLGELLERLISLPPSANVMFSANIFCFVEHQHDAAHPKAGQDRGEVFEDFEALGVIVGI